MKQAFMQAKLREQFHGKNKPEVGVQSTEKAMFQC